MENWLHWCKVCQRFWWYSEFDDYGEDVRVVHYENVAPFGPEPIQEICPDCK